MEENLLKAWLTIITYVSERREDDSLTSNERQIYNYLQLNKFEKEGNYLTASELCKKMNMLKSQMNRTLTSMESRGIIYRVRSTVDARKCYIMINEENEICKNEYNNTLAVLKRYIEIVGEERIALSQQVADDILTAIRQWND